MWDVEEYLAEHLMKRDKVVMNLFINCKGDGELWINYCSFCFVSAV